MFKNLFDLSIKRTRKNAVGFYIVYVLIGGALCGLLSALITAMFYPEAQTFEEGAKLGAYWGPRIAMVYVSLLTLCVMVSRKLQLNVLSIILFVAVIPISFLFGVLGGMIITTVLSTLENKTEYKDEPKEDEEIVSGSIEDIEDKD